MMSEDRYPLLLMKAVDGLLSPTERAEFEALLAADPARQAEYEDMAGVKLETDALAARIRAGAPPPPASNYVGWATALVLLGLAVICGLSMWRLLTDPRASLAMRLGLGGVFVGALLLLGKVISDRLRAGADPYEEIER